MIELLDEAMKRQIDYSMMSWPELRLMSLRNTLEMLVKSHLPSATVYYTVDRKGKRTHIGIYDATPTLNHLGYFVPLQQKAPQQLGDRLVYQDDYSAWYKSRQLCDLWSGAAFALHLTTEDIERFCNKMGIKH